MNVCKVKYSAQLIDEREKQLVVELENETKKLARNIEETKREMEYKIESELSSKQDQINLLLEQNKKLEDRTKQLESKSIQPITNNNTINNHLTIFTTMSPERVTEVFNKHYTIEKLMGGQKELANFVVDQFVAGKDKMLYLCVDRSRKKCMYTEDFETFHEDVNNELLLSQLTPAMNVIKEKVDWTEFEKKYNPHVTQIHDSYDEILAIRNDGTTFRSQLCRRLPSSKEEKDRMDAIQEPLTIADTLRQHEDKKFIERKDEIERIETKDKDKDKDKEIRVDELQEPNQINGVRLCKLDGCRLMYKNQGIYKIQKDLIEAVSSDPKVAQAYEDYVKRGTYKGMVIWE